MVVCASAHAENNSLLSTRKPVKCPFCKQGRICDVASAVPVRNTTLMNGESSAAIYVKCHRCGQLIGIYM